jgi:hypothetical protein
MRSDPDIIPTGQTQQLANPEAIARNGSYKLQLDSVLGKSYAAAVFLHRDLESGFQKAPRPHGPPTSGPPSPGIRNKLAMDAAFRKEHPELQALVDKEHRSDFFSRIRSMLGKRIAGQPGQQQPHQQVRSQAQPHTIDGGESDGEYFNRLRGMLGGRR